MENDVQGNKVDEKFLEQNQDTENLLKIEILEQQLRAMPSWKVVELNIDSLH